MSFDGARVVRRGFLAEASSSFLGWETNETFARIHVEILLVLTQEEHDRIVQSRREEDLQDDPFKDGPFHVLALAVKSPSAKTR